MPQQGWYRTASGREVLLDQLHVRRFDLGWLEGRGEFIRARTLERLPIRARALFPGTNGLLIREAPPGRDCAYPRLIFLAEFQSFQPVNPGADCSSLILVWFGDSLPANLDEAIAEQLAGVAWEDHATDGYY
jgi:hypothetical protein